MRAATPTIHYDADDGDCGAWDVDHYKTNTHSVDGVRITAAATRSRLGLPGTEDLCPEHASERSGAEILTEMQEIREPCEVEVVDLVGALRASVEAAKAKWADQQANR